MVTEFLTEIKSCNPYRMLPPKLLHSVNLSTSAVTNQEHYFGKQQVETIYKQQFTSLKTLQYREGCV